MPTLDDAPIVPVLSALAAGDLLQVFDVSTQQPKTITAAELLEQAVNLLPTADPLVAGALWLDIGVLTVSAG